MALYLFMPKKIHSKPTKCIEYFIHHGRGWNGSMCGKGYVQFEGEYINLSMIRLYSGLTQGYLSKVFNGKKNPTISVCIRIATALGMDLGCFVEALVARLPPNSFVSGHGKRLSNSPPSTSVPEVPAEEP